MRTGAPLIIAGGGLFGGFLALHLHRVRPEWSVLLLEREATLGGNHTWSFHESDLEEGVSQSLRETIRTLISQSWEGTEVRFPQNTRVLGGRYHSIRSEDFSKRICERLGPKVRLGVEVLSIEPQTLSLRTGEKIEGALCVDARGFKADSLEWGGFQKFTGLDVRLAQPHGLARPLLMDATCPQTDGYRFFYLLPWSHDRLLIEDTRYSDSPHLNPVFDEQEILAELARRGWRVAEIERREMGVLPIPCFESSSFASTTELGVRGGDFHEVTGYSLASAARLVDRLAQVPGVPGSPEFRSQWDHVVTNWRKARRARSAFYRFLNRMLFFAATPDTRYTVLERFYTLSESLIRRFYAGETTLWDQIRLLAGRPPVPVLRALPCVREGWLRGHAARRFARLAQEPSKDYSQAPAKEYSRTSSQEKTL